MILLDASRMISISVSRPLDLSRSTSRRKHPVFSSVSRLLHAYFIAIPFSSFLEEYLLGQMPSTKSNMRPHLMWPIVGVDGLLEVFI